MANEAPVALDLDMLSTTAEVVVDSLEAACSVVCDGVSDMTWVFVSVHVVVTSPP